MARQRKAPPPTGLPLVDGLAALPVVTLSDYLAAVSEYVQKGSSSKAAQIRMSSAFGSVLLNELRAKIPTLAGVAGEHDVSGALRTVRADVSESNDLDGLRLAVEIKPVNRSVGKAIWNRFGDIRTFAVNIHLKFPFAVTGGVLVIPTLDAATGASTAHLIDRAVLRLVRAGGRLSEGDAPHLLEGVCTLVYDPSTAALDPNVPPVGSRLRWDEFIDDLVNAYQSRFVE
jgi:hypothetical protein